MKFLSHFFVLKINNILLSLWHWAIDIGDINQVCICVWGKSNRWRNQRNLDYMDMFCRAMATYWFDGEVMGSKSKTCGCNRSETKDTSRLNNNISPWFRHWCFFKWTFIIESEMYIFRSRGNENIYCEYLKMWTMSEYLWDRLAPHIRIYWTLRRVLIYRDVHTWSFLTLECWISSMNLYNGL